MSPPRLSIAAVLALVGALALGMAALVYASPAWVVAIQLVTLGLLFTSILGAIRGRHVNWWRGVALFGWGFLLVDSLEPSWLDSALRPQAHVVRLLNELYPIVYHNPPMARLDASGAGSSFGLGAGFGGGVPGPPRPILFGREHIAFQNVGIWLVRLLFALCGGLIGRVMLGQRTETNPEGA